MIEGHVPEDKYFRTGGGMVLPSIVALRAYLRTIPQHEFDLHVTKEKNVDAVERLSLSLWLNYSKAHLPPALCPP